MTQAASLLYSSQPSISRMIKILSRSWDCTLFIRTRKGVALTPEGEETFRPCGPLPVR
ncbi:MAG: LysR family transcriptional regulator [Lachnospiraceae bacterium]